MQAKIQLLTDLFTKWSGEVPTEIIPLPRSGSDRRYFRILGPTRTALGAYNPHFDENKAFISFSKHFWNAGILVPQVYAEDLEQHIYLIQDLGNTTLLHYKQGTQESDKPTERTLEYYKLSLAQLAFLQTKGSRGLDYSLCSPKQAFDKQSMLWDLSYFKYYFLKLSGLPFHEQDLENDFHTLADFLLEADTAYFLFRDFQARNILIHNEEPYFIDYQGGRKGARQYDVASILFQAKANLSPSLREELLDFYIKEVSKLVKTDAKKFRSYYYGYVLIRCLQVLGAYGFRGLYERKKHFLTSIPFALNNLKWLLENTKLPIALPTLLPLLKRLPDTPSIQKIIAKPKQSKNLTVTISSFSYKRGIPTDPSGNGGGHVFDCRAIHNPGRYAPYKRLTGRDIPVIQFLKTRSEIDKFLSTVYNIVERSVENYIERDFTHLMVSFGCTGGQHHSVFSADSLAKHLQKKYGVNVVLQHIEQEIKNWNN